MGHQRQVAKDKVTAINIKTGDYVVFEAACDRLRITPSHAVRGVVRRLLADRKVSASLTIDNSRSKAPVKNVSFRLLDEEYDALEKLAAAKNAKVAAIVRAAVYKWLDHGAKLSFLGKMH